MEIEIYEQYIKDTKKWIIQGGVVIPHLGFYAAQALCKGVEKFIPGYGLNFILTFFRNLGRESNWAIDEKYDHRMGEKIENNPEVAEDSIKRWAIKKELLYEYLKKLEKEGITDIVKEYQEFAQLYHEEYSLAFLTEYFTPQSDVMFERILKKYPVKARKDIEAMIIPIDRSFMNDEELSALKIGLEIKKLGISSFTQVKNSSVFKILQDHQKKFFWIENNYKHTIPLSAGIFFKRIKNSIKELSLKSITEKIVYLTKYKENLKEKRKLIIKKWNLSKEDKDKLMLISNMAWLHDRKKKANLICNYWLNMFLSAGAKKLGVKLIDLQYTSPEEFLEAIKTKKVDMEEIRKRKKGCMLINDINGDYCFVHGREYNKIQKEIIFQKQINNVSDFRGARASYGVVQGRVKLIINPLEDKIEKGEILVTHMTRPDFVPLMRRAQGIVTDEGGVISHAAIISRELGIPCVVGTKMATKILKDGMLIEVNANHGIIRILKNGN